MRNEPPITLTCPDCGAEWPTGSVKAIQETTPERLLRRHIVFMMPCRCCPSLSKMVRAKQFSPGEANRMVRHAQRAADKKKEGEQCGP